MEGLALPGWHYLDESSYLPDFVNSSFMCALYISY